MINVIDVHQEHDVVVMTMQERMDILNAPMLMQEMNRLLREGGRYFIVDLSDVRFVDADGDYPLLHLLRRAQEVDGYVSLVCPPGNPIRIFYEMLHLDTLFDIVETVDAALVKFEMALE